MVVGAAVGGFLLWHGMNAKLERERSDHALEQSQAEAQLSDLQDALDQSNENYDALYNDYYDLVQEYSLLQQQNENVSDLQAQYDALSDAYDELSKNYNEFADMAEFYNSNACVASDGNDYYHTYACEDWDRQAFYIFNTAYAENELGLKPCRSAAEARERIIHGIEISVDTTIDAISSMRRPRALCRAMCSC